METLLAKHKMYITQQQASLSPPFKSNSLRYFEQYHSNHTPGPGTYGIPSLDYEKTSKYHINSEKKSDLRREFQWIVSNRSKSFFSSNNNPLIGPGSYNIQELRPSKKQLWGKSSRFKLREQKISQPGPGSYDPKDGEASYQKQGAKAVFKSKTPKVSLFQIKQNRPYQEDKLISSFQGINEPNRQEIGKQKQQSYYFASKVPRFLTQSCSFEAGPGSYDLGMSTSAKKQELPRVIREAERSASLGRVENSGSELGPGSYNMNKYEMSRQMQYKGGHFSRQTRFNFRHRKRMASSYLPGPGQYMTRKYNFIQPSQPKILKPKWPKSHHYRTVTIESGQTHNSINENKHRAQFYEINQFDISHKIQKQKEHHEKLKIMDISMAAFNSKAVRFS